MQQPLPRADLDLAIALTPSFWPRFDGARVLITGGTGFIGSWLLQCLQRANDLGRSHTSLVVLTRDADRARRRTPHMFERSDTVLLAGDVSDFSAPVGRLDLCIHAATDVGTVGAAPDYRQLFDTIVGGTRRVLDLAQASGVSRVLIASSGAVYGTQPPDLERVDERFTGAPDPVHVPSAYGNGKRAAEAFACTVAAQSGMSVAMARIFALLGPGMPLDGPFAAGNFIRDVLAGRPMSIQGDGRPVRSYLYAADLVVWLLRILESGTSGQAYNVGSEDPISIRDLALEIARAAATAPALDIVQNDVAKSLAPRYVPNTAKARQTLQLAQYTDLSAALLKTIQWSRSAMTL